jgi:integrase
MAKKRGNNEGLIQHRKSGSWRAQITLDGHRLSFTADTRKECQEWLKKTINQIDGGMTFANTMISLEEYIDEWLTSIKNSIQQITWSQYERTCRNHILPYIGKVRVKDLRPDQIQHLYHHLLEQGVGIHAIRKAHTILHSALSRAVKLRIINRNPVSDALLPKEPASEMMILDEIQVSRLMIAANSHHLEALIYLAVTTGMRQMELLGLKWTDLDWARKTIKVERQLIRTESTDVGFDQTKTRNGRRTIALGAKTIEVLRSHY